MKRCPACKRVENDHTLTFCRADGTPLVGDSGAVSADAGTVRFGSSPEAREAETSVLPQHATDAGVSRPTGPTTVLDRHQTIGATHELRKPKRRRVWVLSVGAIVVIAVALSAYLYLSRGKNTTSKNSIAVLGGQEDSRD
jgi:hypothetical protein